jgi:hypothetical protein
MAIGTALGPIGVRDLIDGYFALRKDSDGLMEQSHRFEGLFWSQEDQSAVRRCGGWKLLVYQAEGQIEVCVISPDGKSSTFS